MQLKLSSQKNWVRSLESGPNQLCCNDLFSYLLYAWKLYAYRLTWIFQIHFKITFEGPNIKSKMHFQSSFFNKFQSLECDSKLLKNCKATATNGQYCIYSLKNAGWLFSIRTRIFVHKWKEFYEILKNTCFCIKSNVITRSGWSDQHLHTNSVKIYA